MAHPAPVPPLALSGSTARFTDLHLARLESGVDVQALWHSAGLRVAASSDWGRGKRAEPVRLGDGVLFERLGVALLHLDPDRERALHGARRRPVRHLEPERYLHALGAADPHRPAGASFEDTAQSTWALQAMRVPDSAWSGRGIGVAVLDSGFDSAHPDFSGRGVVAQSFVRDGATGDGSGHGTHCIGLACGPREARAAPRYGVAPDAIIHAGKILDDDGIGTDGSVLAGLEWALGRGCAVVSLSIGTAVEDEATYSAIFEEVASRALAAGTLVIGAAGNNSARPDRVCAVNHPANCPSILAVGALDPDGAVAPFSCAARSAAGGAVNVVAPGVALLSAWSGPLSYGTHHGTSAAASCVAGVAALMAEADPSARGSALWKRLVASARPLSFSGADVGAGLAVAP